MARFAGAAVIALLIALSLVACAPAPAPTPTLVLSPSAAPSPSPTPTHTSAPVLGAPVWPSGQPVALITGLQAPWGIAHSRGVTFISERDTGRILATGPDGTTQVVATLTDVNHGGEGGLLGLAISGESLFAYSTGSNGNRIQRFPLTITGMIPTLGEPALILDGLPSAGNHNGGQLTFGPDGMLYASVGDAGDPDAAQNPSSLAGKILRLTVDGAAPADNPFPGSLVYSLGHRNVQGIAWTIDGRMFASEFGQNTWDELNEIHAGGNYGWPLAEGAAGDARFIDPIRQWEPNAASPSGLVAIEGSLILANLRGESVRVVPVASPETEQVFFVGEFGRVRAVMRAPDGALWFLTNNTDGRGDPREGDDKLLTVPLVL